MSTRQESGIDRRQLLRRRMRQALGQVNKTVGIPRRPPSVVVPLTEAQERLYFLQQRLPESAFLNICRALPLVGPVELRALAQALSETLRRHEALRMAFRSVGGTPTQTPQPATPVLPALVDVSGLPPATGRREGHRLRQREAARRMDLAAGRPFRCWFLRRSETDHELILNFHHLVFDGWSFGIFFQELSAAYGNASSGNPEPGGGLPLQFGDFAVWQRDHPRPPHDLEYWREHLMGIEPLDLPTDFPRRPGISSRAGMLEILLPARLRELLDRRAREAGGSLFAVLLAAWGGLLGRMAGQDDLVVGTAIANRPEAQLEEVIGCFVNTLALRLHLPGKATLEDVTRRTIRSVLNGLSHSRSPFARVVQELQPERSQELAPLFRTTLAFQNAPQEPLVFSGLDPIRPELVRGTGTDQDLAISFEEESGGLRAHILYSPELFCATTIARLGARLEGLLRHVARSPQGSLDQATAPSPQERHQILTEWVRPAETPRPLEFETLAELFDAQVLKKRDAPAIVSAAGTSWSYRQLDHAASVVASRLLRQGIGPETVVALCLGPSAELLAAILGTLKTGGAYLPLDPRNPPERLRFMIRDAAAPVLLSDAAHAGMLSEARIPFEALDMAALVAAREASEPAPPPEVTRSNLAYVIYTSGSTGRPKGTLLSHGGMLRLVQWYCRRSKISPQDRCTLIAGVGFDVSAWEIWTALAAGACLFVPPADALSGLRQIMASFRLQRITHAFLPTPFANALLEKTSGYGSAESPLLEDLRLRCVVTAGDRLLHHPKTSLPFPLYNCYGPTESTVYSTWELTRPGNPGIPGIGRAVGGTEILVLDRCLEPLPREVFGELCLAGEGLARGYLGLPSRTAQSFVPHPRSKIPGERLYRTGDRVRWNSHGSLEIEGRLDSQIKIRGFRIELGEIIHLLGALPGVRECCVLARKGRLVAYLAWEEGQEMSETWLGEELSKRLPAPMVPDDYLVVESLPLSLNGKVDRTALEALDLPSAQPAAEFVEPRDALEQVVAELFGEILGVNPVGAHGDFFALGGHSLLAGRLMTRLEVALGSQLPLDRLFHQPTVAGLAAELGRELATVERPLAPIERLPRGGDLEISFSQQRLWLVDRLESNPAAYGVPVAVRFEGPLQVGLLLDAWTRLVRRHEALRTLFPAPGDQPVQRILPAQEVSLPVVDLAALAPEAGNRESSCLAQRAASRPMPLATGPLVCPMLLRQTAHSPTRDEEHLFLLTLHHIIADGWSLGVLLRELGTLYSELAAGRTPELPELRIQYADFASWQRRWLEGEPERRQLAFWKEHLADLGSLELPGDRPRPPVRNLRGGRYRRELGLEPSLQIRALAQQAGLTIFMMLRAAFEVFLYRLTGTAAFALGTPTAGRSHRDLEGLVGFFVNTLTLRAEVSGELPFEEHAARVRQRTLDALAHQDLPFERIVEELAPRRSLARTPLFQVMFLLQNAPLAPPSMSGLETSLVAVETGISKFDLSLAASESTAASGAFVFHWVYQKALFDTTTLQRWDHQWRCLLAGLLEEPKTAICDLPLLTAPERHQLLTEWTEPRPVYRARLLAHEQFLRQVRRCPEAVALRFEGRSLSYRELEQRSRRLAGVLCQQGIGPESIVALFVERSFEMVLALLGVLRAGGAYLPLDPASPAERIRFMLGDSGAVAALVGKASRQRWERATAGWQDAPAPLFLSEKGSEKTVPDPAPLPRIPIPKSAAYLIYTSGSTGRPKGVLVSQACLANRLRYAALRDLGPGDAFLHKTALTFDVSILEILGPLVSGGRVVLARPGGQQDADYLLRLMAEEDITQASFPPTLLQVLLDRDKFADLSHLRTVITGGETVPVELPDLFFQRLDARLLNRYGPTETTISVTSWPAVAHWDGGSLPIGGPTAQARIYLLDRTLQPVPMGITAELCIGGSRTVARGYLNRPRRTAESFVPDPFCEAPGARLYRSGDLARQRADGCVQFVGRIDHQVKIRGFRIELGEIEEVLRLIPGVREAAVQDFGVGDGRWLGAFWVREAGATVAEEDLRERLSSRLPDYMQPSAWRRLETFPLTTSGKVDRNALPPLERAAFTHFEAPRAGEESRLAGLWEELLDVPRVGRRDDFFALGGHSLLATRLVSRIREAFAVHLPLRAIFEAPTVERLAQEIEQFRGELERISSVEEEADSTQLPLSFSQERLWFVERLQPGTATYNIASQLDLDGELSIPFLEAALRALSSRHEVLRNTFPSHRGRPVLRLRDRPLSLFRIDLRALSPRWAERETDRLSRLESRRSFDLEEGPLLRSLLLHQPAGKTPRYRLVLTQHHMISDAWSVGLLMADLGSQYNRQFDDPAPNPAPEPARYSDFARWQRQALKSPQMRAKLRRWKRRLAGAPPLLELPTDRPRPKLQTTRGGFVSFDLSQRLTEGLKRLAAEERSTLYMVTLTAYAVLLSRLSGQEDLVIASPVAGRDRQEWEGILGLFVNVLPLRLRNRKKEGFRHHLRRTREEVLTALEDSDLPFDVLVQELEPERSIGHSPIFQTSFALQAEKVTRLHMIGLELHQKNLPTKTTKADLGISLQIRDRGLAGSVEFRRDLFDPSTVQRWVEIFRDILGEAPDRPEEPIEKLAVLPPAQRHQLTVEWNDTQLPVRPFESLPQLIARRARKAPEALALAAGRERWSYRDLEERSGRLAAFFRHRGVGTGSLVAVLLRRSPREVAVLLGILRAGAAYLPLDPAWPEARRSYVLEDAQPALVICEETLEAKSSGSEKISPPILDLDRDIEAHLELHPPLPLPNLSPQALAYVIYTSGSTGQPKGVALHHGGLANLLRWHHRRWGEGPGDRASRLAGQAFDASVWELWPYLAAGSSVHIPPPATRGTPRKLQAWLLTERMTHCFVPTPMAELLLELSWPPDTPLKKLHAAGEALRFFRPAGLPFELLNHYGPTEGTVQATGAVVPVAASDDSEISRPPGIGRPIDGVQALVLDQDLEPRPLGSSGELCIGGAGLARGYLRRPALTASRFVPHPFARQPGDRLYRTGDRVSQRSGGELDFQGRLDRQVKIRGFRIELGEVEAVLIGQPGVLEAVVADFGEGLGRWLGAYWRREPGALVSEEELRSALADRLPDSMQPTGWLRLDDFSKTSSGKIDRAALPPIRKGREAVFEPPREGIEELLATLWASLLKVPRIGRKDHFFDLGGHSLLAARLLSGIEEAVGIDLPLRSVFETPTLKGLAEEVRKAIAQDPGPTSGVLRSPAVTDPFALGGSTPTTLQWLSPRSQGTQAAPLFLIHPVSGTVFCYLELVKALAPQRAVYGMQARGLKEHPPTSGNFAKLACSYIEDLRTVRPHGPYFLGGWSLGGVIAFEMGRRLKEEGETVAPLLLIDSWPADTRSDEENPGASSSHTSLLRPFLRQFDLSLDDLSLGPKDSDPEAALKGPLVDRIRAAVPYLADLDLPRLFQVFRTNVEAFRGYSAAPADLDALLIRASANHRAFGDLAERWRPLVAKLEVHDVEADHFSILRRGTVEGFIAPLRRLLAATELDDERKA